MSFGVCVKNAQSEQIIHMYLTIFKYKMFLARLTGPWSPREKLRAHSFGKWTSIEKCLVMILGLKTKQSYARPLSHCQMLSQMLGWIDL
jgi:hypothetical protein